MKTYLLQRLGIAGLTLFGMSVVIFVLLRLAPATLPAGPATIAAAPDIRENLEYQISLGPWSDVARVHLVLKELEPGHYLAEFSGAAQSLTRTLVYRPSL